MIRYSLLLLAGVAACNTGDGITPPPEELPPADPGIQLPFAAPEDDGMFPQIAWDTNGGIFLPDRPNVAPTTLVRFGLEDGQKIPMETVSGGVQMVAGAAGSVFYTQSITKSEVLSRVGGDDVALVTAVQFAVSRNGRWIVVRDHGWWLLEVETGARRALPPIPDLRQPLAVDNGGTHVVFGLVGPMSEFDSEVSLADAGASTARTIAIPGNRLLAAEFIGDHPFLLGIAFGEAAGESDLRFLSRTDLENSTHAVGTVHSASHDEFIGACGAWSPDAGFGVGVVQIRSGIPRARHVIVRLDTEAHVIGSADLWAPTDCTLSPDGKWFVYGNATGYIGSGELYLKSVR